MAERTFSVLFLCTGNSARSIMAESILNHFGRGHFRAFSAGSHPTGKVNPLVLELLGQQRMPVEGARSKPWDEFAVAGAPALDFVITVCDQAAGEVCPVWPGQPVTAHWGVEDPARHMDNPDEARRVIKDVFRILSRRIQLLVSLPVDKLDRLALQKATRDIAKST
ncbi:MAG TPA: arsenate reductase ArsC [Burkholderiales bacterium]|nr:arsenate reductase ArsC [Burkholderiales bacterium]